ncbi:MAG: glucose-6-phosphate isomerase, partial [Mesorhizobium sp.]
MDQSSFQKQLDALRDHRAAKSGSMREAFAADPQRFEKFSATDGDLLLDWSKCAVDAQTMDLLEKLAAAADLEGRRAAMFSGKKINVTEGRAVLHTALRNLNGKGIVLDGQDVKAEVVAVLD